MLVQNLQSLLHITKEIGLRVRNLVVATWLLTFCLPLYAEDATPSARVEKVVRCSVEDLSGHRASASVDIKLAVNDASKYAFSDQSVELGHGASLDLSVAPLLTLKTPEGLDVQTYSGYLRFVHTEDSSFKSKYVHMTLVGGTEFSMTWEPLQLGVHCQEL